MAVGKDAYVVMGSEDGKVWVWDLQTRECVQLIDSHQGQLPFVRDAPLRVLFVIDFFFKKTHQNWWLLTICRYRHWPSGASGIEAWTFGHCRTRTWSGGQSLWARTLLEWGLERTNIEGSFMKNVCVCVVSLFATLQDAMSCSLRDK